MSREPCGWAIQAEPGECDYCGDRCDVVPDPFGQKPACLDCFNLIIGGDE